MNDREKIIIFMNKVLRDFYYDVTDRLSDKYPELYHLYTDPDWGIINKVVDIYSPYAYQKLYIERLGRDKKENNTVQKFEGKRKLII